MVTACENLATKAELEELEKKVNILLGQKEIGEPINVLAQGNFEGTLIGDQLEFAENSIQDIQLLTPAQSSIIALDDNDFETLAIGTLTFFALKGKDLYKPLKGLTSTVVKSSSKILSSLALGKLLTGGAAITSGTFATAASLLSIVASLATAIANLRVLGFRIDQAEKQASSYNQSINEIYRALNRNQKVLNENKQIAQKNNAEIQKNEIKIQETELQIEDILKDIDKVYADIEKTEKQVAEVEAEHLKFKLEVEAFKGEVTEEIENLKAKIEEAETYLETAKDNFELLFKTTENLAIEVSELKGSVTVLGNEYKNLSFQYSFAISEINKLKIELKDNKIITNSKLALLNSKIVLLEKNVSDGYTQGFPITLESSITTPLQDQLADTQTRTLQLANTLSSNPADVDSLVIPTGSLLDNNTFSKTFDNILSNINLGDLGITNVNIPELAVQISDLITPNINTNIDTKIDSLGIPNLAKDIGNIKTNISTPNLKKTVTQATTDSICNSTKGQGCLAQNIGNPIGDAVKNTAKTLGDLLDQLKEAIDTEVLEKVTDIQKKIDQEGENATLDKTILAGTFLNTLHNAALLSTNVDATMNWIASDAYKALKLKNYQGEEIDPKQWTNARLTEADKAAETTNKSKVEQENRLNKIAPVVPESWQSKVRSNRPQLALIWKPKSNQYENQTSRWSFSIPHPNLELNQQDFIKLIPSYQKGSTQGILTLIDNSKLTIYAKNAQEAESLIETIISKKIINPEFIPEDYFIKTGNTGAGYKELEVVLEAAKFFSKGQKNNTPDWIVFSND